MERINNPPGQFIIDACQNQLVNLANVEGGYSFFSCSQPFYVVNCIPMVGDFKMVPQAFATNRCLFHSIKVHNHSK